MANIFGNITQCIVANKEHRDAALLAVTEVGGCGLWLEPTKGISSLTASLARAITYFLMTSVGALFAQVIVPSCTASGR